MAAGYRAIAAELRAAIERGEYRPGEAIPTLDDLVVHYGVGKETVRRAVGVLQAAGLVVPVRRLGTVVRDRTPVRLVVDRYAELVTPGPGGDPWETACARLGVPSRTDLVVAEQRHAPPGIAAELEVTEGSAVMYRLQHMYAGGQLEQIQHSWLPLSLVQGTTLAESTKVSVGLYRALATIGRPPTSATEKIISRMPTRDEADTLSLSVGSPVLAINRVTRGQTGHVLVVTHAVADGERVQLVYGQAFPLAHDSKVDRDGPHDADLRRVDVKLAEAAADVHRARTLVVLSRGAIDEWHALSSWRASR